MLLSLDPPLLGGIRSRLTSAAAPLLALWTDSDRQQHRRRVSLEIRHPLLRASGLASANATAAAGARPRQITASWPVHRSALVACSCFAMVRKFNTGAVNTCKRQNSDRPPSRRCGGLSAVDSLSNAVLRCLEHAAGRMQEDLPQKRHCTRGSDKFW